MAGSRSGRSAKPTDGEDCPTLDEYIVAAEKLAGLVRQAFDGQVSRKKLLEALKRFERITFKSL